jgi:hypothetical protein
MLSRFIKTGTYVKTFYFRKKRQVELQGVLPVTANMAGSVFTLKSDQFSIPHTIPLYNRHFRYVAANP